MTTARLSFSSAQEFGWLCWNSGLLVKSYLWFLVQNYSYWTICSQSSLEPEKYKRPFFLFSLTSTPIFTPTIVNPLTIVNQYYSAILPKIRHPLELALMQCYKRSAGGERLPHHFCSFFLIGRHSNDANSIFSQIHWHVHSEDLGWTQAVITH